MSKKSELVLIGVVISFGSLSLLVYGLVINDWLAVTIAGVLGLISFILLLLANGGSPSFCNSQVKPAPEVPFQTTPAQIEDGLRILHNMVYHGVSPSLIGSVTILMQFDQGTYDLLALWDKASSQSEKDLIIKDLHASVEDYNDPRHLRAK